MMISHYELFIGCSSLTFSVDCGSNSDSGPNSPPSGAHGPLPNGNCSSLKEVRKGSHSYNMTKVARLGMKPKVRAAELNAEPELFQFKANITYLIKSKAQKYYILRNQHKNLRKIMT